MNQTLRDGLLGLVATLSVGCASEPLASDLVDDAEAGAGSPGPAEQAFPSAEALEIVASQIPGRNLGEHPPQFEALNVTPVAGRDGNARLEVSFRETMPSRLKFLFGGQVRELQDDGQGPDSSAGDGIYTALVSAKQSDIDSFSRAKSALTGLLPETTQQNTLGDILPYAPYSLVVTDLAVANDPARVSDPCMSNVSPSASTKEWSFGYLMTHMANQSKTGKSPSDFAKAWLNAWKNPTTVNGDPVAPPIVTEGSPVGDPANISVPQYIINTWTRASRLRADGSLDPNTNPALKMEKAPFRLLAIVNRPDLRKNSFFGEGLAGELRFVFGVLDSAPDHNVAGEPCRPLDTPTTQSDFMNTTVILEYAVDKANHDAVVDWARSWRDLSLDAPENATYRDALQALTDSVVRAGVGTVKGRANGSALIRLRTNESINAVNWRLREFNIDASTKVLKPVTVKQTPAVRFNYTRELADYVNNNRTAILAENHVVPATFAASTGSVKLLGGQAFNSMPSGARYWDDLRIWDLEARHKFSLNTCNGCHSDETGTQFAHIMSRRWNEPAQLSNFMTGVDPNGGVAFSTPDPLTGQLREFNEFSRREWDLWDLTRSSSFQAMSFQPTTRVH